MNAMHRPNRLLVLLLAALVGAAPAFAAPPWAGGGHGGGHSNGGEESHGHKPKQALDDRVDPNFHGSAVGKGTHMGRQPTRPGTYFDDRNRVAVQTYFEHHPVKPCPPGLAKKNNGCLPPGQAKKWAIGEPLPAGVVYAPVPSALLVSLPRVPPGHKYVEVAGDILLIAIGSKMVVDGINGLTR